MIYVFTSVTGSYLPNARILAESVKKYAPHWHFVLLFNDHTPEEVNWADEPFDEVFFAHWLPIENFRRWAFDYSVVELCTATKGLMSEYLFEERNADYVVYLDPDTAALSPLTEIEDLLKEHDVLLTPHLTDREYTDDGIWSHEMAALKHGTFNLGFFAIANRKDGREFSGWWAERLRDYSYIDHQRGLFTDQKWCNLAPYIFNNVHVITKRTYNVATWNMINRKITLSPDNQWLVNGEPILFYHFSGFGHGFAWADEELDRFCGKEDALRKLWNWYKDQYSICKMKGKVNWYWGMFENNYGIEPSDRQAYREDASLQKESYSPHSIKIFNSLRYS